MARNTRIPNNRIRIIRMIVKRNIVNRILANRILDNRILVMPPSDSSAQASRMIWLPFILPVWFPVSGS
jgi:hypothetical protein